MMSSMYRQGIASLPRRFQEGGFVTRQVQNYVSPTVQARVQEQIDNLQSQLSSVGENYPAQMQERVRSNLQSQIADLERQKSGETSREVMYQVVDPEGNVVGQSQTSQAGATQAALRNVGPDQNLMSQYASEISALDPSYRPGFGEATLAGAAASRAGSPSIAQLMDRLGVDARTASNLKSAVGFNQYDPRNWSAIFAAEDPLAALSAANRAAIEAGIANTPAKMERSRSLYDTPIEGSQFGVFERTRGSSPERERMYSDPVIMQEGTRLTQLGINPNEIYQNAVRFGLDLSNVDALRQAGVPEETLTQMEEAGQLRDYGTYDDQDFLRQSAQDYYNLALQPGAVTPISQTASEALIGAQPPVMAQPPAAQPPAFAQQTYDQGPYQQPAALNQYVQDYSYESMPNAMADYYSQLYSSPYFSYYGTPYMFEDVFNQGVYNPQGSNQ